MDCAGEEDEAAATAADDDGAARVETAGLAETADRCARATTGAIILM